MMISNFYFEWSKCRSTIFHFVYEIYSYKSFNSIRVQLKREKIDKKHLPFRLSSSRKLERGASRMDFRWTRGGGRLFSLIVALFSFIVGEAFIRFKCIAFTALIRCTWLGCLETNNGLNWICFYFIFLFF